MVVKTLTLSTCFLSSMPASIGQDQKELNLEEAFPQWTMAGIQIVTVTGLACPTGSIITVRTAALRVADLLLVIDSTTFQIGTAPRLTR